MQETQTTGATASEQRRGRFQDGGIYVGKPKRTVGGGLKCQLFCGLAGMLMR